MCELNHSLPHATLGMDGIFFFRVDWADRESRQKHHTMEMVWRGSKSLGVSTEIFTGVLYTGYGPSKGSCFDLQCSTVVPIQVTYSVNWIVFCIYL